MNIMYLLFSFTVGGTERLVVDICNEMEKKGNNIHLYIVNNHYSENLLTALSPTIKIHLQRRENGTNKIKTLYIINKYIKANKIDVVHCNSFDSPELLIISKLFYRKVKIIYTIHGVNQYKKLGKLRILYRNIICNKIIAISKAVYDDIIKYGVRKCKTSIVYNGINDKKYFNDIYKELDVDNITIGCVARIMPTIKGQDILVKAGNIIAKAFPNIKIQFAGDVCDEERELYNELIKYISDNKLDNNIHFLGNIDNVPDYLKAIDICVIPSRFEGFGLTLIEAMSMGIPCISSNINGPLEIIKNEGVGTLFQCGNYEELAEKLIDIINNFSQYKDEAWESRNKIRNNYSIEKMCEKLDKIYTEA